MMLSDCFRILINDSNEGINLKDCLLEHLSESLSPILRELYIMMGRNNLDPETFRIKHIKSDSINDVSICYNFIKDVLEDI